MTTQWHTFKDESDMRGACETIRRNFPHAVLEVRRERTEPSDPYVGAHMVRATIRRIGTPQRRGVSPIDDGAERWVDGLLTGWRIAAEGS